MSRRFIVAVFGSGEHAHAQRAELIGAYVAAQGHDLLTGGGFGVMEAACRGYASVSERRGQSIGILPAVDRPGYPNRYVDIAIRTHLSARGVDAFDPASRNAINVLTCDVAVVLPGSEGTRSELLLCVRHGRPVITWGFERDGLPVDCERVPEAGSQRDVERFIDAALGR